MVPAKVDRGIYSLGQVVFPWLSKSLAMSSTTKSQKARRASVNTHIGISRLSNYIPLFIEETFSAFKKWKANRDPVEIGESVREITFNIITRLIFGDDVKEKLAHMQLEDTATREMHSYSFFEAFAQFLRDSFELSKSPLLIAFPEIFKLNLTQQLKSHARNTASFIKQVSDYSKESFDKTSLYRSMLRDGVVDHDGAIADLIGVLFAATDSTAKALTSMFWRLKKHPEVYKNLEREIDEKLPSLVENKDNLAAQLTVDNIDELGYLSCFLKECLRSQCPLFHTITYKTKEELRFDDGIIIPGKTEVVFNL